jgi:hypothetical protein
VRGIHVVVLDKLMTSTILRRGGGAGFGTVGVGILLLFIHIASSYKLWQGVGIKVGDDLWVITMGFMREWRSFGGWGFYHRIREPMRKLISVNLNASHRALWPDGDSELDRLSTPAALSIQ